MIKFVLAIVVVCLTGCATFYDSQDPCQREPYPSFCGAGELTQEEIIQRLYRERIEVDNRD
mgnify:CR=1 FL=1